MMPKSIVIPEFMGKAGFKGIIMIPSGIADKISKAPVCTHSYMSISVSRYLSRCFSEPCMSTDKYYV